MEFTRKYAKIDSELDDDVDNNKSVAGGDQINDSYTDFIDDTADADQWGWANVVRDLQEALQSTSSDLGVCSNSGNFVPDFVDDIEPGYDTFENFQKRMQKFEEDLQIFAQDSKKSIYFAILYEIIYALLKKRILLRFERMKSAIGSEYFVRLKEK